jgi:hypothetical protein
MPGVVHHSRIHLELVAVLAVVNPEGRCNGYHSQVRPPRWLEIRRP